MFHLSWLPASFFLFNIMITPHTNRKMSQAISQSLEYMFLPSLEREWNKTFFLLSPPEKTVVKIKFFIFSPPKMGSENKKFFFVPPLTPKRWK